MLDEKRVFDRRKLKNLMLDVDVRTYKELAKLSGYCEATIREARTEGKGVPSDTARTIVQALSREMDKPNGDKPNGDKPNGDKPNGDKPNGDKPNGGRLDGRVVDSGLGQRRRHGHHGQRRRRDHYFSSREAADTASRCGSIHRRQQAAQACSSAHPVMPARRTSSSFPMAAGPGSTRATLTASPPQGPNLPSPSPRRTSDTTGELRPPGPARRTQEKSSRPIAPDGDTWRFGRLANARPHE